MSVKGAIEVASDIAEPIGLPISFSTWAGQEVSHAMLILGLHPANENWCYFVTMSLIGWAQA